MDNEIKKLPEDVQKKFTDYMERIQKIQWFKPAEKIDEKDVEQKLKFALDCFGVKATLEWRRLETVKDRSAALDAALDTARSAAWSAARSAARDAAWSAAL